MWGGPPSGVLGKGPARALQRLACCRPSHHLCATLPRSSLSCAVGPPRNQHTVTAGAHIPSAPAALLCRWASTNQHRVHTQSKQAGGPSTRGRERTCSSLHRMQHRTHTQDTGAQLQFAKQAHSVSNISRNDRTGSSPGTCAQSQDPRKPSLWSPSPVIPTPP
jgi:hypothetical protein